MKPREGKTERVHASHDHINLPFCEMRRMMFIQSSAAVASRPDVCVRKKEPMRSFLWVITDGD